MSSVLLNDPPDGSLNSLVELQHRLPLLQHNWVTNICHELNREAAVERNHGELCCFKYPSGDRACSLQGSVGQSDVLCVDGNDGNSGEMSNFGKSSPLKIVTIRRYLYLLSMIAIIVSCRHSCAQCRMEM